MLVVAADRVVYQGVHHVGLLVEDLERSMAFYQGVLGLELNKGRPDNKLPYAGAWLWIGRWHCPSGQVPTSILAAHPAPVHDIG